jgi:hypothetical protein
MRYFSSQHGVATAAIAIIVAIVLIGAGAAYYVSSRATSQEAQRMEEKNMMEQPEAVMATDTSPTSMPGDTVMKKEEGAMMKYTGAVLAGTAAPLLDFTKADFDSAIKSDKLVVLYFYANWCPICRAEFPMAEAAFHELTTD